MAVKEPYRREMGRKGEKSAAYGVITAHLKFLDSKTIEFSKNKQKYCYDVQRSLGERYKSEFLQPHGRRWWRFCHNLGAAFQLVVSESGMHHHLESISSLFSVTLITNTLPIFLALYKETRSGSRLA